MPQDIEQLIKNGKLARLIPSISESKKEERATSCLLATFMIVPDFANVVLSNAGARVARRAKIRCYTEVSFNDKTVEDVRPDGLICISSRGKNWTALVESKVGIAEHDAKQVENYLALARKLGINAVITISNQFATLPTHHPLKVSKAKLRTVDLYHFSWLSIISKAVLLKETEGIDDTEQDYVLRELALYLEDPNSGVSILASMKPGWSDVCNAIHNSVPLANNSPEVCDVISSWHQLLRFLTIQLSKQVSLPVDLHLTRSRAQDAEIHFKSDLDDLIKSKQLCAEFVVPNAASRISVSADFVRRCLNLSMKLESPRDKKRSTACINWLTHQLRDKDLTGLRLNIYWPRRIPITSSSLQEALNDPAVLTPEGVKELPVALEVIKTVDLAVNFRARRKFVEIASSELLGFYEQAGQWLSAWVPKAPKVIKSTSPEEEDAEVE